MIKPGKYIYIPNTGAPSSLVKCGHSQKTPPEQRCHTFLNAPFLMVPDLTCYEEIDVDEIIEDIQMQRNLDKITVLQRANCSQIFRITHPKFESEYINNNTNESRQTDK